MVGRDRNLANLDFVPSVEQGEHDGSLPSGNATDLRRQHGAELELHHRTSRFTNREWSRPLFEHHTFAASLFDLIPQLPLGDRGDRCTDEFEITRLGNDPLQQRVALLIR